MKCCFCKSEVSKIDIHLTPGVRHLPVCAACEVKLSNSDTPLHVAAAMPSSAALPHDVSRCSNGEKCAAKEACRRWLSKDLGGARTPFAPFFTEGTTECSHVIWLDPTRPPANIITPFAWRDQARAEAVQTMDQPKPLSYFLTEARRYEVLGTLIADLELELKRLKSRYEPVGQPVEPTAPGAQSTDVVLP
jgi:hypothetical protein